jgi:PAS domain S-box-containing protein
MDVHAEQGVGALNGRADFDSDALLPAEWGPGLAPTRPAILIVDDDPRNLFALEEILADLGHEIVRADSGTAALRHVLVRDFAVILLDVQMPGMDGYDTAEMIRSRDRSRHVPIMFVTAVNKDDTHVFRGYSTGAVDYVFKPLDAVILRSKVAVFVDLYLKNEEVKRKAALERRLLEENYRFRAERLRAEEALRRQDQLRSLILGSLPIALYTERLDQPSRTRRFVSENPEKLFGFSATEFLSDPGLWRDRLHPEDRDRALAAISSTHETSALGTEYRWKAKDGSERYFLEQAVLVRDERGAPREIIGTIFDVTDRKQLEQQLVHAQKMEALGQLTGGIAHDFNNMLSIVIGNLDLLRKEVEHSKAASRRLKSALDGAFRCANMTQRLLTFARRQPLSLKHVDLAELVPSLTDLLRRTLGDKVEIRVDSPPDIWPLIADPAQVEAAVINLAINGRDAMPDGGVLTIGMRNEPWCDERAETKPELSRRDHVVISVTDTGTGMPPELLARVFEPFFTTKGIGHGTGLGLSTTYGFVKGAGGHIEIESQVGEGTTVRLYLPRAESQAAFAADAASGDLADARPTGEVILVVEDNDEVRGVAVEALGQLGYGVVEASDADQALQRLDSNPEVKLLFTDVRMPGRLTGVDLAREAVTRRPGLKVLYTSGYVGTDLDPNDDVLQKPYRAHDLAVKVRQVLRDAADGNPPGALLRPPIHADAAASA